MNEAKTIVLIVDDDLRLRDLLTRYLSEQGFATEAVVDGAGLDKLLEREQGDVLVLDLMLPGEDGLSICRRLRAAGSGMAIIMLTAKGDDIDRIVGLEIGADDYMPKPFNPRELVACVHAVLRRPAPAPPSGAPALAEASITFGSCVLDLARRSLSRAGQDIALTTGPGIPSGSAQHLMQPFTRLDASRTNATGSGLGLAIVDRIARSHGGSLSLLARAGGGLEARVELPV